MKRSSILMALFAMFFFILPITALAKPVPGDCRGPHNTVRCDIPHCRAYCDDNHGPKGHHGPGLAADHRGPKGHPGPGPAADNHGPKGPHHGPAADHHGPKGPHHAPVPVPPPHHHAAPVPPPHHHVAPVPPPPPMHHRRIEIERRINELNAENVRLEHDRVIAIQVSDDNFNMCMTLPGAMHRLCTRDRREVVRIERMIDANNAELDRLRHELRRY